jgi:hypothetical protein
MVIWRIFGVLGWCMGGALIALFAIRYRAIVRQQVTQTQPLQLNRK